MDRGVQYGFLYADAFLLWGTGVWVVFFGFTARWLEGYLQGGRFSRRVVAGSVMRGGTAAGATTGGATAGGTATTGATATAGGASATGGRIVCLATRGTNFHTNSICRTLTTTRGSLSLRRVTGRTGVDIRSTVLNVK